MSTSRFTFLYLFFFRSARIADPAANCIRSRTRPQQLTRCQTRTFAASGKRDDTLVGRHGKAVEPFIPDRKSAEDVKVFTLEEDTNGKNAMKKAPKCTSNEEDAEKVDTKSSSAAPLSEESRAATSRPAQQTVLVSQNDGEETASLLQAAANLTGTAAPMETDLQMPPQETIAKKNASKPPHLQTPPYVHHFDTYTLVQQVEAGGFTAEQSITAMKAVRGLLDVNLDVAKAGLVSKSDVENESYLFRAACSELRTEVQNMRRKSEETIRRERTLLQHEVDVLNQKLTQELLTLKDDLKGMFDDRKMAVRMEQRTMESKIQELNYKITVLLNSDSKSEVEGLRWVLTRRSVMGILFMAFMVLTSLRYASYKSHENSQRRKHEASGKSDNTTDEPSLPLPQGAAEISTANKRL